MRFVFTHLVGLHMEEVSTVYFLSGPETTARVKSYFEEYEAALAAANGVLLQADPEAPPVDRFVLSGRRVCGFIFFDERLPRKVVSKLGLRLTSSGYLPNLKSSAGRELKYRLSKLPRIPDSRRVLGEAGPSEVGSCGCYMFGDAAYLQLRSEEVSFVPVDCVRVKHSEFWAAYEADAAEWGKRS
jgi:hypothetical protein